MAYLKKIFTQTPQTAPIPGTTQVPNSAGGYAWQASQWDRLKRFLILGSEGGSYYAGELTLTIENANHVLACIFVFTLNLVQFLHACIGDREVRLHCQSVNQLLLRFCIAMRRGKNSAVVRIDCQ